MMKLVGAAVLIAVAVLVIDALVTDPWERRR